MAETRASEHAAQLSQERSSVQQVVENVTQADFGHTFKLFIEFKVKIDGLGVLETKCYMKIDPE